WSSVSTPRAEPHSPPVHAEPTARAPTSWNGRPDAHEDPHHARPEPATARGGRTVATRTVATRSCTPRARRPEPAAVAPAAGSDHRHCLVLPRPRGRTRAAASAGADRRTRAGGVAFAGVHAAGFARHHRARTRKPLDAASGPGSAASDTGRARVSRYRASRGRRR